MQSIVNFYLVITFALSIAGLSMVGVSISAYTETGNQDMVYLALGFGLIVASALGTAISVLINNFTQPVLTLTLNNFFLTVAFLLMMYSLTTRKVTRIQV